MLGFMVLFFLAPLYVMVITSLKTMDEIRQGSILALPRAPTLQPWLTAWFSACTGLRCNGISVGFVNSVKILIPSVIVSIAVGALTGYALSFWRVRGAEILFGTLMVILIGVGLVLIAYLTPLMSVRSTEEIVSLGGQQEKAKRASASRTTVPEYDDIASGLADKLETRVTITSGRSRGKLTVEFAGSDDLHRILDALGPARRAAVQSAARELLVEVGFESLTAEEIASRAEVPIGTLYQYFANKYVIVCELDRQDTVAVRAAGVGPVSVVVSVMVLVSFR